MGASALGTHILAGSVDVDVDGGVASLSPWLGGTYSSVFMPLGIAGGVYSTDRLFGGSNHDFVVSLGSQLGGLSGDAVSEHHGLPFWHCAVGGSDVYAEECARLLTDPLQAAAFAPLPALPPGLTAAPRLAPSSAAEPLPVLTVLAPAEGSSVAPGSEVPVTLQVAPEYGALSLSLVATPDSFACSEVGDPTHVLVPVPLDAAGEFLLLAVGWLEDGTQVVSPEVRHLNVDLTGREPIALHFLQPALSLEVCDRVGTTCLAECADGTARSAELIPGVQLLISDPAIATVEADGTVVGVAPGDCELIASYLGLSAVLPVTVRPAQPDFSDVPADFWAFPSIRAVLRNNLASGYQDGTFQPTWSVTRDQMAVFLARGLAGGEEFIPTAPATSTFSDVAPGSFGYKHIEYVAAQKVASGFSDGTFAPRRLTTRGQTAAFLARSMEPIDERPGLPNYTPPASPSFPDVAPDSTYYKAVEYVKAHGVASGFGDGLYHSDYSCTRAQMAVFLTAAFGLTP